MHKKPCEDDVIALLSPKESLRARRDAMTWFKQGYPNLGTPGAIRSRFLPISGWQGCYPVDLFREHHTYFSPADYPSPVS